MHYLNFILMLLDNRADPGFSHRHLSGFGEAAIKCGGNLPTACLWHKSFHTDDFFCYPFGFLGEAAEKIIGWRNFATAKGGEPVSLLDKRDHNL